MSCRATAKGPGNGHQGTKQQVHKQQQHVRRGLVWQHAYSVIPPRPGNIAPELSTARVADETIPPMQPEQPLDDPAHWVHQQPTDSNSPQRQPAAISLAERSPTKQAVQADSFVSDQSGSRQLLYGGQAASLLGFNFAPPRPAAKHPARSSGHQTHRHPPIAPEDPAELLQVLQVMDHPRRRVIIFKGGGYVYADMEAMIDQAGLGHVMRLTNLMRKAHCIVAKERRDNGKPVNLSEHQAAARNARIPFLLLERLEPDQLVALLRPVLIQKRIVIEHPQRRKTAKAYAAAAAAADVSSLQP